MQIAISCCSTGNEIVIIPCVISTLSDKKQIPVSHFRNNQSIYIIILLSFCKQNDQSEITESFEQSRIVRNIAGNYTNQSIYIIILLSFCKQNDQNEITSPYIALSFCKQNDNGKTNF